MWNDNWHNISWLSHLDIIIDLNIYLIQRTTSIYLKFNDI
jgi:hypothetical protein